MWLWTVTFDRHFHTIAHDCSNLDHIILDGRCGNRLAKLDTTMSITIPADKVRTSAVSTGCPTKKAVLSVSEFAVPDPRIVSSEFHWT